MNNNCQPSSKTMKVKRRPRKDKSSKPRSSPSNNHRSPQPPQQLQPQRRRHHLPSLKTTSNPKPQIRRQSESLNVFNDRQMPGATCIATPAKSAVREDRFLTNENHYNKNGGQTANNAEAWQTRCVRNLYIMLCTATPSTQIRGKLHNTQSSANAAKESSGRRAIWTSGAG